MIRPCNYGAIIYSICFVLVISSAVDHSGEADDLKKVLSELEKVSSLLQSVNSINDRLINNLRVNATRYLRSNSPELLRKRGYTCTSGIGWHKLYLANLTWNEARKACRRDDAHLAVLNSPNEAKVYTRESIPINLAKRARDLSRDTLIAREIAGAAVHLKKEIFSRLLLITGTEKLAAWKLPV
ncbi:uncharacterized protein LOC103317828 [Nasonia vitripennis]|uniref:C-type lectin domain-containing protein n=1 Tax=Nasonia vitripennis TaxID=7425 RepID=A0A7M7R1S2_NASVI|nr:uncharacterized protein LOC103317828 [Nasonia vitripennis]